MLYGELDLKSLRENLDLDFAHFTYTGNLCSCCYGPSDLPSIYWKNREVINSYDPRYSKINYILFKNASNGSGTVTKNNEIKGLVSIEWNLESKDLLIKVCKELYNQLNNSVKGRYWIGVPKDKYYCIEIIDLKFFSNKESFEDYINIEKKHYDFMK